MERLQSPFLCPGCRDDLYIPLNFSRPAEIPNLAELQQNLQLRGGSIIEFRRVRSVLVLTQIFPRFEWVEHGGSRFKAGLPHTTYCFLAGWWSPMGLLANLGVTLNNLLGGVDVTPLFRAEADEAAIQKMERERRRQRWIHNSALTLCVLALIVLGIYLA